MIKKKELELKNQSLIKEKDELFSQNKILIKENQKQKEEVTKLKPIVDRFALSSNKLQMIIDSQKAVYDKVGLGYNTLRKQKFLKNIFINASTRKLPNITCFRYDKVGHKAYSCLSNKFDTRNIKKI